jgi:N utilization substance protein B
MPSRRQIREAVIQFLYCADLEGGADPTALRDTYWEFVTESDRRRLQLATFRTVHHLSHGRGVRLAEFHIRATPALAVLRAHPEAESIKSNLERLVDLEQRWDAAFSHLDKLPSDEQDDAVVARFDAALRDLFVIDRELAQTRARFLHQLEDHVKLRGTLEPVSASVRRLQRISDRIRMVEEPERFPDQADLTRLRQSRTWLTDLRRQTDALTDQVLLAKKEIDERLAAIVENYAPERIDPVDRAILRLGAWEILHHPDVPKNVAINEAIELAKRFGTTDSGRFVNGVLDRLAKNQAAADQSVIPD